VLGDGCDGVEMDILVAQSSIDNSSYYIPLHRCTIHLLLFIIIIFKS
jgi:hypothetical protein